MVSESSAHLTQKVRLGILAVYLVGLFIASKLALDSWLPPTTEKGVWFYSALAAILLGSLLITPFFTKPADAIAYAVASVVTLLAVDASAGTHLVGVDQFTWFVAIAYAVLVLVTGIASIVTRGSGDIVVQRISKSLFVLCDTLGTPRAIFSVVFLFALLTFHRRSPREYLTISVAWGIFVGLHPLEELAKVARRLRTVWTEGGQLTRLGEIVGHEVPDIVLIREDEGRQAAFGDVIVARSDDGSAGYALALDHVGFAEGCWLRAIHLSRVHGPLEMGTSDGSAYVASQLVLEGHLTHPLYDARDRLVGLVAPETTAGHLNIELVRTELSLHQGSLVEVEIGAVPVLYQIIDGVTREEMLQLKNTRGFIRAEGKKVGTWNAQRGRFDPIPWLPQPNRPVLLVPPQERRANRNAVGFFPETPYPVTLDLEALVTHNSAILGILGIGKSFLALELVERMIEANIKPICFDLTDQYSRQLDVFYDINREKAMRDELDEIGRSGKSKVSKNVEEGGSVREFAAKVKEHLREFLGPHSAQRLKLYNPVGFEVWRQDSRPYQDQASMASLTPCEITRTITEAALEVLQEQGITDRARCCLVYEEAHSLIPEWNAIASEGDRTATNGTAKAILQGRKFGLGCLVITQRTANVTKSILNQCNTVFALRVFDATGMEFLRNYIGDDYAGVLSNLEDRHAVVFGRASSCREPVLVRLNDREDFLGTYRKC